MNLHQLINKELPPLKTTDTVAKALQWMQLFHVRQLPVLRDKEYVGVVEQQQLAGIDNKQLPLSATNVHLIRTFLHSRQHYYTAFSYCANNGFDIIPLLNDANEYEGVVTLQQFVAHYARIKQTHESTAVIVIECAEKDYDLSKIVGIAEANDAQILGVDINENSETSIVEVTLRLDNIDLSRIEAGFYRLGYNITAIFNAKESFDDLQDRYNALMKYINM